jgi:hypothetical protein
MNMEALVPNELVLSPYQTCQNTEFCCWKKVASIYSALIQKETTHDQLLVFMKCEYIISILSTGHIGELQIECHEILDHDFHRNWRA